ncbi:MAG TPA: D-alanyl-D-alanine carboxypeptidase family protein [Syntrophorhabdales bacterium]|nr:D-alanyl-D-alanine carboxypeptidase family protein [Syntrophorhabdales bacterium]
MMKRLAILLAISTFLVNLAFVGDGWAKAVKAAPKQQKGKAATAPAEKYKAYLVMEANSGKVLEEENAHEKRAPASMVKLMVADIVMEKLARGEIHLTDKITASKAASKIGGSQVYLKEGEEFTLEELMQAMMIHSANDAAYAIAEFISGNVDDFVALMNEKVKDLKMSDTEFHSVHGLPPAKDQKEDLTSCYDMAILARELVKYPKLMEWTSTKQGEFRGGKFILTNTNKLLTKMSEVDGLKTGYYRSTGFNITVTAKKGNLRLIVVVMGSSTGKLRDEFALGRLKTYFSQYVVTPLVKKGDPVDKEVFLEDGKYKRLKGICASDFSYPLLKSKKKEIKRILDMPDRIKGEVKEGQKLGEIRFQLDDEVIGKVDVVSPVYVPKANLFTRIFRKLGLGI